MTMMLMPPGGQPPALPSTQVRVYLQPHAIWRRVPKIIDELRATKFRFMWYFDGGFEYFTRPTEIIGGQPVEGLIDPTLDEAKAIARIVPTHPELVQQRDAFAKAIMPKPVGREAAVIIGTLLSVKAGLDADRQAAYLDAMLGILEFEADEFAPFSPAALASVLYEQVTTVKFLPDVAEIIPMIAGRQRQLQAVRGDLNFLIDLRQRVDDCLLDANGYNYALGLEEPQGWDDDDDMRPSP